MIFMLLMVILLSATAVAATVPLIRLYGSSSSDDAKDVAVYDDQLKEVERDLSAGTISPPEAAAAKLEIQKRLDAARQNRPAARPVAERWRAVALVACAGMIIVGGVGLYGVLGSPAMMAPAQQAAATGASGKASQDVDTMIANLKARLQANPQDQEGWRRLAWAYFNLQKYQDSADAYAKAVELDPANSELKSAYAEALTEAAQGTVVPKAQALIAEVLAKDPKEPRARFYDALAHEQAGDQQGALDRWLALLGDAPADAPWRENVKRRAAGLGKALGKDISAALNAVPTPPAAPPADGADATPTADQQAMIAGMVQKLADKMKANPKDGEGWVRLMQAYMVLNQPEKAKAALNNALAAFDGDAEMQGKMKSAAESLGFN